MRKQYHFRRTEKGLLAWDVGRLVSLTATFPVFDLPLMQIKELDEPFWFDGEGEVATPRKIALHGKLIAETDLSHPIILSQDGRVMDGMHRVCKALMEKRDTISAVQFETDPEPDYVGVSPEDLPY